MNQRFFILLALVLNLLWPGTVRPEGEPQTVSGVVGDVLLNSGWLYYEVAETRPEGIERPRTRGR